MPDKKPHEIEITYSNEPQGQVGPKPRKIPLKEAFRFTTKDLGILSIEFTGDSPLADGSRTVQANTDVTASKPGRYPFTCTLESQGIKRKLGVTSVGGELEVPIDE